MLCFVTFSDNLKQSELRIVLSYEHKALVFLTREKIRLIPITFSVIFQYVLT